MAAFLFWRFLIVNLGRAGYFTQIFLGQKSCKTKIPRNFRILSRIFLRNFPGFFEDFWCLVSLETDTTKIHQNPLPVSMPHPQANTNKNTHIILLRACKVRYSHSMPNAKFDHTKIRGTFLRVSGLPGRGVDLWGDPGKFRGTSRELWETSGEPLDCS